MLRLHDHANATREATTSTRIQASPRGSSTDNRVTSRDHPAERPGKNSGKTPKLTISTSTTGLLPGTDEDGFRIPAEAKVCRSPRGRGKKTKTDTKTTSPRTAKYKPPPIDIEFTVDEEPPVRNRSSLKETLTWRRSTSFQACLTPRQHLKPPSGTTWIKELLLR